MRPAVLIDTGPLVALLNVRDAAHAKCQSVLKAMDEPLLTTWPVITEAAWLLRKDHSLVMQLLRSIDHGGFVQIAHLDETDTTGMATILNRYADQAFQLADVSLMHLANALDAHTVVTLDVRDFSIFKKDSGKSLRILPDPL